MQKTFFWRHHGLLHSVAKRASSTWVQGRQRANWTTNATLAHSCLTTRQRQSSTGRCTKDHKCVRTIYRQLDWAPAPFDRSKSATHLPGDSRAADHEIRPRRWLRPPSVRASSQKVAIAARVLPLPMLHAEGTATTLSTLSTPVLEAPVRASHSFDIGLWLPCAQMPLSAATLFTLGLLPPVHADVDAETLFTRPLDSPILCEQIMYLLLLPHSAKQL